MGRANLPPPGRNRNSGSLAGIGLRNDEAVYRTAPATPGLLKRVKN